MNITPPFILAISSTVVAALPDGFTPINDVSLDVLDAILDINNTVWDLRPDLEENPEFRQFIPYGVIAQNGQVLRYRRPAKTGESRLSGKTSIGFGGHVEKIDKAATVEEILLTALVREISEEVFIDIEKLSDETGSVSKLVGFIKISTTPVDQVHLGAVYQINLPDDADIPDAEETEVAEIDLVDSVILSADPTLENWSKLLVDTLVNNIEHEALTDTTS